MSPTEKIFRDPLYNYISLGAHSWLLDLIDTAEFQRLRRIHQLGVSHLTYPGADHSRLLHTLGVVHLMLHALQRVSILERGPEADRAQHPLLAAALLHDIGHGPFSHLFEPALGIDHEYWSCEILRSPHTEIHQKLKRHDIPIDQVIALIEKNNRERPPWQKTLLSSELDVDRLDYLRRDSYFTGSGYGHYDWYRIVTSFSLHTTDEGHKILVWPEKSMYAIEEYIFSRFYMYSNVYQHKTTRGFEKLIHSAWKRARQLQQSGVDAGWIAEISAFLATKQPTVEQYLMLEDASLIYQLKVWSRHSDKILADLSWRFLARDHFAAIDDPVAAVSFDLRDEWETALRELVGAQGLDPDYYMLRDDLKLTIYNPYIPEREEKLQDPYNAIVIQPDAGGPPREISSLLMRLGAVTGAREKRYRYYVPAICKTAARNLAKAGKWSAG